MRKKTTCDGCGKAKALSMCSGDFLCSSCAALAGAVSNRIGDVATMVVKRGKVEDLFSMLVKKNGQEWLMQAVTPYLPEQVTVKVENDTLDRIAAVVGYSDEDGDGLIAGVDALFKEATDRFHLLKRIGDVFGIEGTNFGQLVDRVQTVVNQVAVSGETISAAHLQEPVISNAERDLDRVYTALKIEDGDEPQIEVIIEAIALLTNMLDRYRESSARYAAEKNLLADQLSTMEQTATNLEQTATVNEQIFARLREILQADGLENGELPSAIESLLYAGQDYQADRGSDLAITVEREALADFGLKVISGQVTVCHREA